MNCKLLVSVEVSFGYVVFTFQLNRAVFPGNPEVSKWYHFFVAHRVRLLASCISYTGTYLPNTYGTYSN